MAENEKNIEGNKNADAKKVAPKKDKVSLFAKIAKFFREYKSELKKISWYSRKDTINGSILVVVCIVLAAVVTGALDFGFSELLTWLGKLI